MVVYPSGVKKMKDKFHSHYTPSMMLPEALEKTFVQRHDLAIRIVELIHESVTTKSKHHTLLIGPRGIGKTHLISLIYHRIKNIKELDNQVLIVWLREEEWGVMSFLDFLIRILVCLVDEYNDEHLNKQIEALYKLPYKTAEERAANILKDFIGNKTLLIITENLDELFYGLKVKGQNKLRAYIQDNPLFSILATSQGLFNGISSRDYPFYGFFHINHLDELSLVESIELLSKLAELEGNINLATFMKTPKGRARIRALHHLASGNHRLYIIFAQFITRESLDELVGPVMKTLDELTPYYQSRMKLLSPQQRKIIEYLCNETGAIPVKNIAARCFITQQSASSQLKTLRDMGYVKYHSVGRDSYYELQEPLMRLSFNVKKNRGRPIALFVDFLRLWYSPKELKNRLELSKSNSQFEKEYLIDALRSSMNQKEDPHVLACLKDFRLSSNKGNYEDALKAAEDMSEIAITSEDFIKQGRCFMELEIFDKAITSFKNATQINPKDSRAWFYKAIALEMQGSYEEALKSINKAVIRDKSEPHLLYHKGKILFELERSDEAMSSFKLAIKSDPDDDGSLFMIGIILSENNDYEGALEYFNKSTEATKKSHQKGNYDDEICNYNLAKTYFNKGHALLDLNRYEKALEAFNKSIELYSNNERAWNSKGIVQGQMGLYDEALSSLNKSLEIKPDDIKPLLNKSNVLYILEKYDEALDCIAIAIKLEPRSPLPWISKGSILNTLERYEEALEAIDSALNIDSVNSAAWYLKSISLAYLQKYQEALGACETAIRLNDPKICSHFHRVALLFTLNRPEEANKALTDAIYNFTDDKEHLAAHTTLILNRILLANYQSSILQKILYDIITSYKDQKLIEELSYGLVSTINLFISDEIDDRSIERWINKWNDIAHEIDEFALPLTIMDAASRYLKIRDKRVLLELPEEERSILLEILGPITNEKMKMKSSRKHRNLRRNH